MTKIGDIEASAALPEAEQEVKPQVKQLSPKAKVIYIILSLVVLGLVQLITWVGLGMEDPFFPKPVTILQIAGCIASLTQIVVFIPSYLIQTEKYFDITGTITYIICVLYTLLAGLHANGFDVDIRAVLASTAALVWTTRLGYFLFARRHRANVSDTRFDELMPNGLRFVFVWNVQGLWVLCGLLPVFILNSTQNYAPFMATDVIGGAFYVFGFVLEIIADHQKSAFNSKPENKGKWIDTGLWYYSRHPNYFFEWILQCGLFLLSVAELRDSQFIAMLGPVFVACLLWFVSGVPMLERRADAKWAGNKDYLVYRRRTSVCFPWFKYAAKDNAEPLSFPRRMIVADGYWK